MTRRITTDGQDATILVLVSAGALIAAILITGWFALTHRPEVETYDAKSRGDLTSLVKAVNRTK